MSYIGSTPTTQSFISGTDYFNGDGSTTAFTLSRSVVSTNDIQATVNNVVQQPNTAYTVNGTTITFTSAPSAGTGNIYVRYLSTTTQSITPSQNTVSYSTLNRDNQSKLGISFKNRMINGACVIDQRNAGASVTITSATYVIDRWKIYASQSSKLSAQQNAGSVTPPTGFTNYFGATSLSAYSVISTDIFAMQYFIEGYNVSDLGWGTANAKTVTLSFQVYSSLTGTFGGALLNSSENRSYPFSYTISSANTWTTVSVTIPGDTTGTWLTTNGRGISMYFGLGVGSAGSGTANTWSGNSYYSTTGAVSVVGTNGATFYLTGVQLEVGTQATTFDYRSYGTELALCQRYCQVYGRTNAACMMVGQCYTTSQAYSGYQFIAPMRAAPTLSYSALSDWAVNTAGAGPSILTAWSIVNATTQNMEPIFTGTGTNLVAGNATALQAQTANATFTLSAEL